jgi:hypothetical protein
VHHQVYQWALISLDGGLELFDALAGEVLQEAFLIHQRHLQTAEEIREEALEVPTRDYSAFGIAFFAVKSDAQVLMNETAVAAG